MQTITKIEPKLGVIYTRVSSGSQLDGGGLNSQLTNCKKHCEHIGIKVVHCFEDGGVSGGKLDRPGVEEMFGFIDTYNKNHLPKISCIIADNADRIARDVGVHRALKIEMSKRGIELITVNQKFENTPQGHFIETMMAANAQLFREENTHRVISRQEARLMDGYRPFDYPAGYTTVKAPVGGKLMVRQEPEASIIQEALEDYAHGVLDTQHEVAQFLSRKGLILTRRTKNRTKNGMGVIHNSFVGRMLSNILYAGYISYIKTTRDRKTGVIKKSWNVPLRKAKHEGLISLDTYYKIQERMKKKKHYKVQIKKVSEDFPLRGFLFCDCCDFPLSSGIRRKKGSKDIPYYTFSKRCSYKGKGLNADRLHAKFDAYLDGLKMEEQYLEFLFHMIKEEYMQREGDKVLVSKNIEREIKEVEKNIDNVVNTITTSQSEIVRRKLEQKIEELEMTKHTLMNQLNRQGGPKIDMVLNIALDICKDPLSIRKQGTIDEKRMFLKVVFRQNLPVNKKLEDFGTLPISALFALKRAYLMTDLPTFGDDREYFEHLYDFVSKTRFESIKSMIHRYSKDFRPDFKIEEKLSDRQKILYEI